MKKFLIASGILLTPALAFAQGNLTNLQNLVIAIGNIVRMLIPIVFGIAFLVFFWGLAKYILSAGSEEGKAQGRHIMIGGIIAIFVMASIWGIVAFLQSSLGISSGTEGMAPSIFNL